MARVDSVSSNDQARDVRSDATTRSAPTARLSQTQLAKNDSVMRMAESLGYGGIIKQIMNDVVVPAQLRNAESMYRDNRGTSSTGATRSVELPRTQNDGTNRTINQFAYSGERMGENGRKVSQAGCLLSSMTMAANRLNGRSNSVIEARDAMRSSGALNSEGGMSYTSGAKTMGLTVLSRRAATHEAMDDAQNQVQSGRALIVGVNYKPNVRGEQSAVASGVDHYIMLDKQNSDGSLSGVDPAGGVQVTFRKGADGVWRNDDGNHNYDIREVGVLASADSAVRARPIPRRA